MTVWIVVIAFKAHSAETCSMRRKGLFKMAVTPRKKVVKWGTAGVKKGPKLSDAILA